MNNEQAFLTVEEVSNLLGLSEFTVRKYARNSLIPAMKVGRDWQFESIEKVLTGLSITRGNKLQHAAGRVRRDFSFPNAPTTGVGIIRKPKTKKKPADMKTEKTTQNPNLKTRIKAARDVFKKYAPFLAEVEAELNHPPGFIFEMLLGGSPQNPWSDGFESRESLQEQCSRHTKNITDEEVESAAWEITHVFGNLEIAPLNVHDDAAQKVKAVIRRHCEEVAA